MGQIKEKIVFVDLLYADGGSFDEDFEALKLALSKDFEIKYIKLNKNHFYKAIPLIFYYTLFARCKRVVFLSSKLSALFLFTPLRIFAKFYAIYHFIPRHRMVSHKLALCLICKIFKIGVYSSGVSKIINNFYGVHATELPSRVVDKVLSIRLLREKLSHNEISVLVPALRAGVRRSVEVDPIVAELKIKLGYSSKKICFHGSGFGVLSSENLISLSGNLERSKYNELFQEALIVAINFEDSYETRASGVILDALSYGCIVVSNEHPIVIQYGFPDSVVTDIKNLKYIVESIKNGTDEYLISMIPGAGLSEFREKWITFLN
jgi:hypothetical protein